MRASMRLERTVGRCDIAEKGGAKCSFACVGRGANIRLFIKAARRLGWFRGARRPTGALRRSKTDRSAGRRVISRVVSRCRAGRNACVASPALDQSGGGARKAPLAV